MLFFDVIPISKRVLDLPDSIRFGRVEASCEAWKRPGDPMVLKGASGFGLSHNTFSLFRILCTRI